MDATGQGKVKEKILRWRKSRESTLVYILPGQ